MARRNTCATQPVDLPPPLPDWDAPLPQERTYRQYRIRVKWSEPIPIGSHYQGHWIRDLPPGRFWNGSSFDRMPKEDNGPEPIVAEAREWFTNNIYGPKGCINWGNLEITVEFYRDEVWMLEWFSHFTYDIGLSDKEVLDSFQRFVYRMERANRKLATPERPDGPYCLMGAEDRWRWFGRDGRGGRNDKQTDPPCRCDSCKEQGVVRIAH